MPGREMHQSDRQRLKDKKIERDVRKRGLGTRQEHCRDCSRPSSVAVLVDRPKGTALHFPNWFSFEMTNGSTRPRNSKQLPGPCSFGAQKRVSGASPKLGREAGRYQQGMLALWMIFI